MLRRFKSVTHKIFQIFRLYPCCADTHLDLACVKLFGLHLRERQDTIREAFKDWVFRDPDRRQDLVAKYNKLFNSTRPREYAQGHFRSPHFYL